jgi:hypothetical protein
VTSFDPYHDIDSTARAIANDPTATHLVDALEGVSRICMVGWSGHLVDALVRRGDVHTLVLDSQGDGQDALRYLSRHDVSCELVAPEGVASAVEYSDAVVLSALSVGDDATLCAGGAMPLAAVAYCIEQPVWMVAAQGTRLPRVLHHAMESGMRDRPDPWASGVDLVPHVYVTSVFSPLVKAGASAALSQMVACPPAEELLRRSVI